MYLFSDHNGVKPEIINQKTAGKPQNTGRVNNILLSSTWVKEKISMEILKYFELNEYEIQLIKIYRMH